MAHNEVQNNSLFCKQETFEVIMAVSLNIYARCEG